MVGNLGLCVGAERGEVVRIGEAVERPRLIGLQHRMIETFEAGAGEIGLLVQDELEIAGQRGLDRGAAKLAVALRGVGIADREIGAGDRDRIEHPRPLPMRQSSMLPPV